MSLRSSWRLVVFVLRKEGVETLRDRRTIIVALLLPVVLMPVITLGVPYLAQRQQQARAQHPAGVAVVGRAYAPDLVALGVSKQWIQVAQASHPQQALQAGQIDAVLDIPADFSRQLGQGQASVTILYDESRPASMLARGRLQEVIAAYSVAVTERRLQQRGLTRHDLAPITVRERNIADERKLGGALLAGLLPFFIAVWAVLGGQYVALDVGAGEKERRTLETLLVAPPPRWVVATGKFLAVVAAALAAVLMVIIITLISLRLGARWGLLELQRAAVAISVGPALLLVTTAIALVAFLSALQLALSLFARSLREAQQYFTPVYLLLSLPAMAAQFLEGWDRSSWTYLVPGLNAVFVFRGLLLGSLQWTHFLLTLASTAVYTAASLALAVRFLRPDTEHRRG